MAGFESSMLAVLSPGDSGLAIFGGIIGCGMAIIGAGIGIGFIGGKAVEWDDRKVVRALLSRELRVEIRPGQFETAENVCFKS